MNDDQAQTLMDYLADAIWWCKGHLSASDDEALCRLHDQLVVVKKSIEDRQNEEAVQRNLEKLLPF